MAAILSNMVRWSKRTNWHDIPQTYRYEDNILYQFYVGYYNFFFDATSLFMYSSTVCIFFIMTFMCIKKKQIRPKEISLQENLIVKCFEILPTMNDSRKTVRHDDKIFKRYITGIRCMLCRKQKSFYASSITVSFYCWRTCWGFGAREI